MVFVLVEASVVIWVGGSSSSSSSAQFVRVLGELEEGFFRIERYAVVAAIVVGKYVFVRLMVGKKFSRCFLCMWSAFKLGFFFRRDDHRKVVKNDLVY